MGANGPLRGHRVIDLGRGQAACMATLFLAQLGAAVVRFEDRAGPPALDPVTDALWNRDKERRTIDSASPQGRAAIAAALADADILIPDRLPSEALGLGLDGPSLCRAYPRLVHGAIGAWPVGHARQETPVDDAIAMAEAGILD